MDSPVGWVGGPANAVGMAAWRGPAASAVRHASRPAAFAA